MRESGGVRLRRGMLLALVFACGMTGMAVEMAGSRLLAPYFGNSLIVWANLIGLIMVYLTVGYYLGGWLADRHPTPIVLLRLTSAAALCIALIPLAARPVLGFAAAGFTSLRWGLVASSFIGVVALFAAPMVLLGCVSPFAIRLDVRGMHAAGRVAGGIYGLSTLGSIVGTFLPVFVLIPTIGTRSTFGLLATLLAALSCLGLWSALGRRAWPYLLVPLAALALWWAAAPGRIKPDAGLVYEAESMYNYIQVTREGETYFLKLNEGEGNQSVYIPGQVLVNRVFDYFLAAPLFRTSDAPLERICIIGLAGGTIARQYTAAYGPLPIDGVEIDPEIAEVGRRYFDMTQPNLAVHALDGRQFLQLTERRYDVIVVDAYVPPYIPFHLATAEFFAEAAGRLSEGGVVAVNVGRTATDRALVEAIANTMAAAYPAVFVVEARESYNSMVVGASAPMTQEEVAARLAAARIAGAQSAAEPLLANVAQRMEGRLAAHVATGEALRDDRAPVEQIVHGMIWRVALGG